MILHGDRAGRRAVRGAGDDQDPDRHRRRPPDLPRRRPDRRGGRLRGDRAARADGPAGLLRRGRLDGDRRPQGRACPSRCSATATSGRPPTRCGWWPRPAWTAWSSAAAASAGPGCSATWPTPSPAGRRRALPTLGEVAATVRRHAELLVGLSDEAARLRRPAQAHGLVLQGLPGRRRAPPPAGHDRLVWPSWTRCWPSSTPTCPSRRPSSACPAAGRAPRGRRSRCREGWLDDTSGRELDLVGAELGVSGG